MIAWRWLPIGLFLALAPLLIATAIYLYRRDRRLLGARRGWILTFLRAGLFVAISAVLLDLALVETHMETEKAELLVVTDVSSSMAIADMAGEDGIEPRIDHARRALASGWLSERAETFRVTLHALTEEIRPLGDGALAPGGRLPAEGSGTDLGAPLLEEVLRRPRGSVAGIVLLTDGNHNAGRPPQDAARALGGLGVPIVAIGVGPSAPPPDLALAGIDATGQVFQGDEVQVEVVLENTGLATDSLPIAVTEGDREVAAFTVERPPETGASRWPLRFRLDEPGRHKLTIGFSELAGEATARNNRRDFWVEVRDETARVLLIDGSPRWEYRYLRNTWERDEKVDLDAFLASPPPERKLPAEVPRERDAVYEYDAIVLGDVGPELFTREEEEVLYDFVRARGGTLIAIAGPRAMPYAWRGTRLADLLPVELLSPEPPPDLARGLARDAPPLDLTAGGETSAITRLVPGLERNVELWGMLPGPRWLQPVAGLRAGSKLLAVLETRPHPRPVLAARSVGAGSVLFSGIDETWRWRLRFGDLLYTRFWGQVVRWAVSERLEASDENVRLGTDRVLYRFPDAIEIAARVLTGAGQPLEEGLVDAVVTAVPQDPGAGEGGRFATRVPLSPVPESGGRWEGRLEGEALARFVAPALETLPPAGERTLECEVRLETAEIPGYGSRGDRAAVKIAIVHPTPDESLDRSLRRSLLEELAALSGGAYLPLERLREATRHLPEKAQVHEREDVRALIDWPWALAAALLAPLVLEWGLRRRWKLV